MRPIRRVLSAFALCALAASMLISIGAPVAGAGVPPPKILVTSTADLPDTDTGDDVCLASNGKCTLRAAVMQANAQAPSPFEVVLAKGTYTLSRKPGDED